MKNKLYVKNQIQLLYRKQHKHNTILSVKKATNKESVTEGESDYVATFGDNNTPL